MARHLNGWVKLHKRLLGEHSWVGHDGVALAVFVTLLLMANSEDGLTHVYQGELIKRGQVVTSDRQLAQQLGFPRTTIQRKLDRMAQDKMLVLGAGRWRGIITILNYKKYQDTSHDDGPSTGPEVGHDRAHNEEVGGVKENISSLTSASSKQTRARPCACARVDPWRISAGAQAEARRILAKALGAPARAPGGEHATDEDLWAETGDLARAVILTRYKTFRHFWSAYWMARDRASQTMVDGQFREEFAAILTDPEFEPTNWARAIIEKGAAK